MNVEIAAPGSDGELNEKAGSLNVFILPYPQNNCKWFHEIFILILKKWFQFFGIHKLTCKQRFDHALPNDILNYKYGALFDYPHETP